MKKNIIYLTAILFSATQATEESRPSSITLQLQSHCPRSQANLRPVQAEKLDHAIFVVHGTFAAKENWYEEDQAFAQNLKLNLLKNFNASASYHAFRWSGSLFASARIQAAGELATTLAQCPAKNIYTVSHSHGGNIVNLASQLIRIATNTESLKERQACLAKLASNIQRKTKQELCNEKFCQELHHTMQKKSLATNFTQETDKAFIENLIKKQIENIEAITASRGENQNFKKIRYNFLLATPIDEEAYQPDTNIIGKTFSLYSKGDFIQPVLGLYNRTYSQNLDKICNLKTKLKKKPSITTQALIGLEAHQSSHPCHSEMHSPAIAEHLFDLPIIIKALEIPWIEIEKAKIEFSDYGLPPELTIKNPKEPNAISFDSIMENVCDLFGFNDNASRRKMQLMMNYFKNNF